MRRLQRVRHLRGNPQRFFYRYRASPDALGQRLSRHELHHQEVSIRRLLESVDGRNIGMIQRRQHPRFALESRHAFGVVIEGFGKELDGHTPAQLRVRGLIDVAHPARSQVLRDLVVCELGSNHGVLKCEGGFYQSPLPIKYVFG